MKVDHRFCGNPEEEEWLGLLLGPRLPGEELWAARRRVREEEESSAPGLEPSTRKRAWKSRRPQPRGSDVHPDGVRIYPLCDGDPLKGPVPDALVCTWSSENEGQESGSILRLPGWGWMNQ